MTTATKRRHRETIWDLQNQILAEAERIGLRDDQPVMSCEIPGSITFGHLRRFCYPGLADKFREILGVMKRTYQDEEGRWF